MLNNTVYKLNNEKKLTVGYFGGSITEGAGASDPSKCWRSLTTQWLRSEYPDCEINEINAAIGGTGSDLGVFRCERDLLAGCPDLVFYEFSCNDFENTFLPLVNNCESIFRKIWTAKPYCDIVVVYTMIQSMDEFMAEGNVVESRSAHSAVAFYYKDILQIDMGEILRRKILSDGGDWFRYTVDTVHPNDAGYEIYANAVREKLSSLLATESTVLLKKDLPKPLFAEGSYVGARLADCTSAKGYEGWSLCEKTLCDRYPHYIEAVNPGLELRFEFFGPCIGLYWMMAKDSGDIEYRIDSGEWKRASSWDEYCKNFNRAHRMMLAEGLEKEDHTLILRVSNDKNEESEGRAVRIGAFLVCD